MPKSPVVAYLTSVYARASDSFVRGEVEQMRHLGYSVHTFSIRRPSIKEVISDDIRRERAATEYILTRRNVPLLAAAAVKAALGSPARFIGASALALRCSVPGIRGRTWAAAYLVEACFLAERMKAKQVGHLHNHFGEGSATVAMLAAYLLRIPYSLTIHGSSEFDRAESLALDEKIKRAAFVAAVSEYGRSQLWRWCRLADWPKVKIVRCGVGERFHVTGETPLSDPPRLVYVGRLDPGKGLVPLLKATAMLVVEGIPLQVIIIGDGPMRDELNRMIEADRLGEKVLMRGWQSSDAVREELLGARALVLPSFAENLPVAIMEALALGRPVVSTYIGAIPELVREGLCGWLVPAGSVRALKAAMHAALTASPERIEEMGQAGAALVRDRHDAAHEARKLAALIEGRQPDITQVAS